jgi:hypothetical protein
MINAAPGSVGGQVENLDVILTDKQAEASSGEKGIHGLEANMMAGNMFGLSEAS